MHQIKNIKINNNRSSLYPLTQHTTSPMHSAKKLAVTQHPLMDLITFQLWKLMPTTIWKKCNKSTDKETPEQRASWIFAEDEEIQRKRIEKKAQAYLVTGSQKRLEAYDKHKVMKVYRKQPSKILEQLLSVKVTRK